MGGQLSILGDIYSYGVLLLEMFTGKRPTDSKFEDDMSIYNFVLMALPNHVMDLIDPSMLFEEENDEERSPNHKEQKAIIIDNDPQASIQSREIEEHLVSVMRIGLACSTTSPRERMPMKDILKNLYAIRDSFLRSSNRNRRRLSVISNGGIIALFLWDCEEFVDQDKQIPPLRPNPTIAQIKQHEEEKMKKDKVVACLHSALTDAIFTSIMHLETANEIWDELKGRYESSERMRSVKLYGEAMEDFKVVEKMLIRLPGKFEAKVAAIGESCDLKKLTISKMISKLQLKSKGLLEM
ncbi:hypothetical protein EZV62_016609 [Acer yangbiense]|uniref:Protein kinase domain-containing protein n=1 Tax=Acer yangbiense TaxID=1000413 RepID=A0A5C7HNW7_9ROSI|nr:hypothetical protein EZV62_016609 [Acer yangbiense]